MNSIGRASVMIGAGTVVSRLTGFLRSIVLVAALGATTSAGNAFAVANQLPNNVYTLISTGLVAAVIVPQIVKAAAHADGGSAFISKLMTLAATVLMAATAVAMAVAPWLVQLFAPGFPPAQQALTLAFAYWCLPQIMFYGLYALVGEALNARRVFGPYTWSPVVNNIVSIAGFVAFMLLFGTDKTLADWTPGMITLIGGTATAGIALQALILLAFWRRAGLHVRPDFHWRGAGLRGIGRLAGWTFLMVLVMQIAGLVQSQVMSAADKDVPGVLVAQNAWLLFMLPYSVIVISIGTPYFTRLSEHVAAGRSDAMRDDIGTSIRTLGVFMVLATAVLAAASIPASRVFTDSPHEAEGAGIVLLCYLVGLVPLSVLFVIQRSFYAYNDTRTPFFFTVVQAVLTVATALLAHAILPLALLTAGIALGQGLAMTAEVILAAWLLHHKIHGIHTAAWLPALGRFVIAGVPAGAAGWGVFLLMGGVDGWTTAGRLPAIAGSAIIAVVCAVVYTGVLALVRAPELAPAVKTVRTLVKR